MGTTDASLALPRFTDVSNDVKFVVGMCVIVLTMFGSATLVSYVMIELVGRVRTDIQDLRESMEALACGEFARKAATNRIELSTRTAAGGGPLASDHALPVGGLAQWPSRRRDSPQPRICPSEQSGFPAPTRTNGSGPRRTARLAAAD